MNSNENRIEPPNDVDAHVMTGPPTKDDLKGGATEARRQRLVHGDQLDDDVEAHVLPADLSGVQPPRDLDIER